MYKLSFGPYFNNGRQNPFYIELTKSDDYYHECMHGPDQALFTVGIYSEGRTPPDSRCKYKNSKSEIARSTIENNILSDCIYVCYNKKCI
jgi:hypothetical protein